MEIVDRRDARPATKKMRWWHWLLISLAIGGLAIAGIFGPDRPPLLSHGYPPLTTPSATTTSIGSDWYAQHGINDTVANAVRNCSGNPLANSPNINASQLLPCLKYVIKATVHNGTATVETPYGRSGATMPTTYHGGGVASYDAPRMQDADLIFTVVVHAKADLANAQWGEWQVPANPYTSYLDGITYELYLCLYDQYSAVDPTAYPYDTHVPWEWSQVMPQVLKQAAN